MKRAIPVVVLLATLTTLASLPQTARNSIEGVVLRSKTTEPIAGATITLAQQPVTQNSTTSVAAPLSVVTNGMGRFGFRDVVPGQYTVRASKSGYFSATMPGTSGTPGDISVPVTVTSNQTLSPMTLFLAPSGTLSGRVRGAQGEPFANVTVTAYQVTYRDGRPILTVVSSRITDDRGDYRLFWLPAGDYYVAAVPSNNLNGRTFFPNAVDVRSARPIHLTELNEVAGIDIVVQQGAWSKISGTVVNAPAAPGSFYLIPRDPDIPVDSSPQSYTNQVSDRSGGRFEIRNVPPGDYDLIVLLSNGADAPAASSRGRGETAVRRAVVGRVAVDVRGDLAGVSLPISRGAEVRARVVAEGTGGSLSSVRLTMKARENYPNPFDSAVVASPVQGSPGTFRFSNVPPARYTFIASGLPAGAYVADVRVGGSSIYDGGLLVRDASGEMVDVVIGTSGGTIRGSVLGADQKVAGSGLVVLVPIVTRRTNTNLYKTAMLGGTGEFTFTSIPPGDYKLFAWESISSSAYQNSAYLANFEALGQNVRVTLGSASQVQLRLIPKQ